MGVQVAITLDTEKKPSYAVSTVLATAFAVAAQDLVVWIGNAHGGSKLFEVNAIRSCLEKLREISTPTPSSGKHSYAKVAVPGRKNAVITGNDVADTTALTGTVSITAGLKALVGVGTAFTTELEVGDVIVIGGEYLTVSVISSDTELATAEAHVAGASGAAYALSNVPSELDVAIWYGDLFQQTSGASVTPHVLRAIEKYLETTQKAAAP